MHRLIFLITVLVSVCNAQWSHDPDSPKSILLGSFFNSIVADGNGGAVIIGRKNDLFVAQKVDKNGYIVWDPSQQGLAVVIPDSANDITIGRQAFLWSDGEGGIYIGYDYYDFLRILTDPEYIVIYDLDTYVQHLDASGNRIWGNKGVPLSTLKGTNPLYYFVASSQIKALAGDGDDGIIAVWNWGEIDSTENRVGGTYMQRIDRSGSIFWEENGRQISTSGSLQVIIDDEGSASIIILKDIGASVIPSLMKVNLAGQLLWEHPLSISIDDLILGKILSDGAGGCYLIVPHEQTNIKAHWFDSNGNQVWGEDGISVVSNINRFDFLEDAVTHDSGFVCVWSEFRSDSTTRGIYTQYIDGIGQRKWGETGLPISVVASAKNDPVLIKSSDNQFIYLFGDLRNNTYGAYAQKIDENGIAHWPPDDVLVRSLAYGGSIVSDGEGGAIIAQGDPGPIRAVYVEKIDRSGNLGGIVSVQEPNDGRLPLQFHLYQNTPNPFTHQTSIQYTLKSGKGPVQLKVYNIRGEEVVTLVDAVQTAGAYVARWSGYDQRGKAVAGGIYFCKLQVGQFHQVKKLIILR